MSRDELYLKLCAFADEIDQQNEFGALHIFVADGNCEDEHIEFCLEQQDITPSEKEFAERCLRELTEQERFGAWAFAQIPA